MKRKGSKLTFSEKAKRFVVRYAWAGPPVGFIAGMALGTGALWQYLDHQMKVREAENNEIKMREDVYSRQQDIGAQISTQAIVYFKWRDKYYSSTDYDEMKVLENGGNPSEIKVPVDSGFYEKQNQFWVAQTMLRGEIREYNQLEADLALRESRLPQWYDFHDTPMPTVGFKAVVEGTNTHFSWDPYFDDPILDMLNEDLKNIYQIHGQAFAPFYTVREGTGAENGRVWDGKHQVMIYNYGGSSN